MAKAFVDQIREAMQQKTFVRFSRAFEEGFSRGYVLDLGPKFFLFLTTDDGCRFDGFQCVQIKDVRRFRKDPYAEFQVAALRARKQEVARKPRVNLGSTGELLASVGKISDLVTLHRHKVKPEVCWVGEVIEVTDRNVTLLEIGPDAQWEKKPSKFALKEITEIDFGGGYEEALILVGGKAPKKSDSKR